MRLSFGAAAVAAVFMSAAAQPALAQDAADAKAMKAPVFSGDVPGFRPAQIIDFVQAYLPLYFDNPDFDWLPVETLVHTDDKLRLARNTRGGGWTKVGVASEVNVFVTTDGPAPRINIYYAAIQNRGGSFEKRTDISDAAGFYRVAKSFHEDTPKSLIPNIQKYLALAKSMDGRPAVPNPSRKFFITPQRSKVLEEMETAYVAGDHAKAAGLLQDASLANNSAAFLRLAYISDRGDGVPKDPRAANEHLLKAVALGDVAAAGSREFFGVGTEPNKSLGYLTLLFGALSGNTDAMFTLATILSTDPAPGTGYADEAYRLYFIAGELGHVVARAAAQQVAAKASEPARAKAAADAEVWKKLGTPRKY